MASKVEGDKLQGLICPMCLEVFKDPTILSCGHTFCKGCLEAYDEQHYDLGHIVCPVCRQITELGQHRVAGLKPNFSAREIQVELNIVVPSPSFCPLHSKVHNDIFCEVCKEFVCLTCYLDTHRDHEFIKKEELENDLKEKRNFLIQKGEEKKNETKTSLIIAEEQRIEIDCHFSNVEKAIKDDFAKRVIILQENEEKLLKKLDSIRKDTANHLEECIVNQRQVIDNINSSTEVLRAYKGKNLDTDTIKAHRLQCSYLEKSLEKTIDEESIVLLKQTAESTRFRPSDKNLLVLGHIELEMKETTSNIQHVKTATDANKKGEQVELNRKIAVFPALVENKSLNIVRKIDAPCIFGMSALSPDAVVVGYGWFRHGADCFSVSGEKKQHLKSEVGEVHDIAILTDGRSVVSHGAKRICVYSLQDTNRKSMQYTCKEGGYPNLCSDQNCNVYAVNSSPEIYIFHGENPNPQRVVPTGDIKPRQICVTKTGVFITSTCNTTPSTVTVFDREGRVGSSITASKDNEYLFAAVDSQDRVLVARVWSWSDVFRLTRYTLQGTTLIEQITFHKHKLHSCVSCSTWSCMISLTPKLLTFGNDLSLYFIELAV